MGNDSYLPPQPNFEKTIPLSAYTPACIISVAVVISLSLRHIIISPREGVLPFGSSVKNFLTEISVGSTPARTLPMKNLTSSLGGLREGSQSTGGKP